MTENEISYQVIGAIYKVYNELGPGLLESVYEAALCYQLRKDGLKVDNQVRLPVIYDGHVLPVDLRLDVLVEDKVIVELKSVTEMKAVYGKQLLTYLKISILNLDCWLILIRLIFVHPFIGSSITFSLRWYVFFSHA